jgi:hypothetical protein
MGLCSICQRIGHNRNNHKYHSKKDIEEHDNRILSEKIVSNIFKKILNVNNKMDFCEIEKSENEELFKNGCYYDKDSLRVYKKNKKTIIGHWNGENVLDENGEIIDLDEYFKIRKNCDNKPSELIEASCHIIPNMVTKDDILKDKPDKLIISNKNWEDYSNNINNDPKTYKKLIENKYEYIKKLNFDKDIEYIYVPGKCNDEDVTPQEIKDLIKDYDLKENKSDYYIKFVNGDIDIIGYSVKDTEYATKINYAVEKCIKFKDPKLSKNLNKLRKDICRENGVYSDNEIGGARDDNLRKILNKSFKRDDLYHTTINIFIIWNIDYVKEYIINNMFSVNVDYPIYECINGKISNINKNNIIESKLVPYPDAELKVNGEERDIAKLFYKLIIIFDDNTKKEYRIETRTKGSWWAGSIQFQSHLI